MTKASGAPADRNIVWHCGKLTEKERFWTLGQKGAVELVLETHPETLEESTARVLALLRGSGVT